MNPPITNAVLQKLQRRQLKVRWAAAATGIGERRSKAVGHGLEFADHRPYAFGDNTRHLDRHVYARLRQHVIRQYSQYQQLSITIVVDASASMRLGSPPKIQTAIGVAAGLAFVGLTGGDRVRVGAFSGDAVRWHRLVQSGRRVGSIFTWLQGLRPSGASRIGDVTRQLASRVPPEGLLVIVSDWFFEDWDDHAGALRSAPGQELLAIQVLAPEEIDPPHGSDGDVRLVDVETGHEVEAGLGSGFASRYARELLRWRDELRDELHGQAGRYLFVRSDVDLERFFLKDLRESGVVS